MRFYVEPEGVRYDFILNPGSNPSDIKMMFSGQDGIEINNNELILVTSLGEIIHKDLLAFQNSEEKIRCDFIKNNENIIEFDIDKYNKNEKILIDPLIYSSFIGGGGDDSSPIVKFADGNTYILAHESFSDAPITEGAFQKTGGIHGNPVIFKIDFITGQIINCTYFTCINESTFGTMIEALDINNNKVYLSGLTSLNHPITENAFLIEKCHDDPRSEGFISIFNIEMDSLLYSSYICQQDTLTSVLRIKAADDESVIFTTWQYNGNECPWITDNAYKKNISGIVDFVINKFEPFNSNKIIFSTYFGGSDRDEINDLNIDKDDNILLTGITSSFDFPLTDNAFIKKFIKQKFNSFLTIIDKYGSNIKYSTFLDSCKIGSEGISVTADNYGNITVLGETSKCEFYETPDVFDFSIDEYFHEGIFLRKISKDFDLLESVLIELEHDMTHYIGKVQLDEDGNIHFAFDTKQMNLITTPDAVQPELAFNENGTTDIFYGVLNSDFTELLYSTYLGGIGNEEFYSMDIKDNGYVLTGASSSSYEYPVTDNATFSNYAGEWGHTESVVSIFHHDFVGTRENNPNNISIRAYPNPATTEVKVNYTLEEDSRVELYLSDMTGGNQRLLENAYKLKGEHDLTVDATGLASGVYIINIKAGTQSSTYKFVLMK